MATHMLLLLPALLTFPYIKAASVPMVLPDTPGILSIDDPDSKNEALTNKYSFTIIRNSTIPCNLIHQQKKGKYRYHKLSTEDKMAILELKGGSFMREYMAIDEIHARETFPSLLEVDFKYKNNKWKHTKAAIKQLLDKQAAEAVDKQPKKTNGIFYNNTEGMVKKDKDSVFVRPKDVGLPDVITNNEGGYSQLEMCLVRGTRTMENTHLYMCTTCSATTNLGETYWPAIINEATCIPEDPSCFIAGGMTAHGLCKQKVIPMWVLKKRDGYCALALKNDESVIVDEWFSIEREVQIGCECVINVASEFAQYVGHYDGL